MEKVLPKMAELGLNLHREEETVVFIAATDPDDACANAVLQICYDMRTEKGATYEANAMGIHKLSNNAQEFIRVVRLVAVSPYP